MICVSDHLVYFCKHVEKKGEIKREREREIDWGRKNIVIE